jgi:hypothetical protein
LYRVLFISFFLLSNVLFGQNQLREKLYTYFDGLPSDHISFTSKSKNGYLNIITSQGLTSFDGYRFLNSQNIVGGVFAQFVKDDTLYFEDLYALRKVSLKTMNEKPIVIQSKVLTDDNPNNDHFKNIFIDSSNRIWCNDFNQLKYIETKCKIIFYISIIKQKFTKCYISRI